MFFGLVSNVLDVLFLCGMVIGIDRSLHKKHSPYLLGVMFGLITIFVINDRITVVPGHFYDFRNITMTLSGFIGGPITAGIAAGIGALYRLILEENGSMGGVTSIIVFACFGSILGRRIKGRRTGKKLSFWFLIGIIMTCISMFIMTVIPPGNSNSANVLKVLAVPTLIINPLATTIIFNFYFYIQDFLGKASILNTIIHNSSLNLMIYDTHGPIMLSKNLKMLCQSSRKFEELFPLQDLDMASLNRPSPNHREISTEDERHFSADLSCFQMPNGEYACVAIVDDITNQKREQQKLKEATDRFRKAFHLGPLMMSIIRKSDYKYLDVNDRFLEKRDFTRKDVIGKTPVEIGVPESLFKQIIESIESHGSIQNLECSLVTKYGFISTAILSAETILVDDQECILFAYNDVTEIKQLQMNRVEQLTHQLNLEADLARSNQLIADIIDNMPDAFYVLDNQWRFTFVNKQAEELLQKRREELLGRIFSKTIPQIRGSLCELNLQKAKNDCLPITFDGQCFLNKDIWNQVTVYPSQFGFSVYYRDITEQKLTHEKLLKSQTKMSSILESMTDCFYAVDQDLHFTYVNRAAEIAFGKSRDKLLGKKITEVYKLNNTILDHFHEVIHKKKSVTFEILSEDLGDKWLEMSAYPAETGITCYFRDITSRKAAEKKLRQSEDKFSKAFHGGPIMMTLASVEEGEFLDVNEALCSGTGYTREEFIGHTSDELNFLVDANKMQELGRMLMVQGKIDSAEIHFRTKSGEIRHALSWSQLFYLDGRHCHITGLIDVTEQKRIQKEMAKIDRLNLVGQLAAGIAHEIRNPMTTVRGYLQLLSIKPEYTAQESTFNLMVSELDRANSIITEFLSLAQTKHTELKSQNLNDILYNLYPLLEADTFTQNKQICFLPGEIPNLNLNAKEITQLILNLTRNGLESMPEKGCLTLESYLQDDKVVLAIEDEGCGIPPENNNKLGTPFFTTKDNGTGLGLATCYRIAESHNAKICVDSTPEGTTFYILFPIPDQEHEHNNMIA